MKTQTHTKSQDRKGESQSKAFEKSRVYVVHKTKTQNVHKKILGTKCKIKRTKEKKENLVVVLQTLELLCMECEKTNKPINNSTKTKMTSKVV